MPKVAPPGQNQGKAAVDAARPFPVFPATLAGAALIGSLYSRQAVFTDWLKFLALALAGGTLLFWSLPKTGKGVQARAPMSLDTWLPLGAAALVLGIGYDYVKDDNTSSIVQLSLSLGACLVIGWGYWLAQNRRAADFQLLRDRLLVVVGAGAALGYCNFGHLHFNNFIHTWDTYHYYMGAKYFPEIGYERLYDCAVVADSETGRKPGPERVLTDLRTNVMLKAVQVLENPDDCKSHFTPARWEAFKKDIVFFRARVNNTRWEEMHHDHGFNATPVWILAGVLLANTGEATLDQITFVDIWDPIYLVLMGAMLWWAFGPRVFAIGMLMIGTNWASRFYYWTGGAMLRHDWLFFAVAVVCLLKMKRPFWAGAALAYAALLRLFPGLMLAGPLLAGVEYARVRLKAKGPLPEDPPREGLDAKLPAWVDPAWARFMVGGAIATALLVGASLAFLGGLDTWKHFAANTAKHAATPLTNHMGLRTVISYRPWPSTDSLGRTVRSTVGAELRDGKLLDAWSVWKDTRVIMYQQARPLFYLLVLASLVLLYFAIRGTRANLWLSASLGVGMMVIGAELTNYYYVFFVALACAFEKRREAGLILSALSAVCIFIMLTPLGAMSGWQDEQSTTMSGACVLAVLGVWWYFTDRGSVAALEPEPAPNLFPQFAVAAAPSRTKDAKKKKR